MTARKTVWGSSPSPLYFWEQGRGSGKQLTQFPSAESKNRLNNFTFIRVLKLCTLESYDHLYSKSNHVVFDVKVAEVFGQRLASLVLTPVRRRVQGCPAIEVFSVNISTSLQQQTKTQRLWSYCVLIILSEILLQTNLHIYSGSE